MGKRFFYFNFVGSLLAWIFSLFTFFTWATVFGKGEPSEVKNFADGIVLLGILLGTAGFISMLVIGFRKLNKNQQTRRPSRKVAWIFPMLAFLVMFIMSCFSTGVLGMQAMKSEGSIPSPAEPSVSPTQIPESTNPPLRDATAQKNPSGGVNCEVSPGQWVDLGSLDECKTRQLETAKNMLKNNGTNNNQTTGSYPCTTYYGLYYVSSQQDCAQLQAQAQTLRNQSASAIDAVNKLNQVGGRTFQPTPVSVNIPTQTPLSPSYPPTPTCTPVGNSEVTICQH